MSINTCFVIEIALEDLDNAETVENHIFDACWDGDVQIGKRLFEFDRGAFSQADTISFKEQYGTLEEAQADEKIILDFFANLPEDSGK